MVDGSPVHGSGPPAWLELAGFIGAGSVLCYGGVGLLLTINAVYRPVLAFVFGTAALAGLVAFVRRRFARRAQPRSVHAYAVVGVLAIGVITAWNAGHASQHVLTNRDGGAYATEARWIARDGSLRVQPVVAPFTNEQSLSYTSWTVDQVGNGDLQFQFAHLLPVVLAEAFAIGGSKGLFHAPELLGGLAMLEFLVLAWRLFRRPFFALAAMLTLAVLIPEVSFSRDAYSEIPSQILLFSAIWVLVDRDDRVLPYWRYALVGGLFLGATQMTRVDAPVDFIGLPLLLAIAWLVGRDDAPRRQSTARSMLAFAIGLIPGTTVGFVDLVRHSGSYFADHSRDVYHLLAAVAASSIVGLALVVVWRFAARATRVRWHVVASAAAVLVGVLGFGTWILRPHLQTTHADPVPGLATLQAREHLPIDVSRAYSEFSLTWMRWYLGPITLSLAIVGATALVYALMRGRYLRTLTAVAILAPGSLLYLWAPNAVPDHVWTDRRFLPGALPALVLLAIGLLAWVASHPWPARLAPVMRIGAVILAIAAVAYPLHAVWPVRSMTEERGWVRVMDDACNDMGAHPAAVVLAQDDEDLNDDWIPQALRAWCGADVAILRGRYDPAVLRDVARAAGAQHRTLWVVGANVDAIRRVLPDTTPIGTRQVGNTHLLQATLTHRPDTYTGEGYSFALAPMPQA